MGDDISKMSSIKSPEKIEWPIVILRGNGNIYILCAGIDTERYTYIHYVAKFMIFQFSVKILIFIL